MQQPPALTPQQAAIQDVRSRYELGHLPFETFKYALDALLKATTPAECQAILEELPAPLLDPFPPRPQPWQPAQSKPTRRWMVALIGGVDRTRAAWRLAQRTIGVMGIGGIELDLSLAALPERAVLRLYVGIGGIEIYVPHEVSVTVKAFTMIGGVEALGEERGGFFTYCHEDVPAETISLASGAAAPHVEIQVVALVGGLEVRRVEAPVITGKLSKAAARALLAQPK